MVSVPKSQNGKKDDDAELQSTSSKLLTPNSDVYSALTNRYSKSKLPQHKHLIATASALKSILISESLPLTPPGYFAAAISAFDNSDKSDTDSIAVISSFLSILLSVEGLEIGKCKAKDAAFVVAEFLMEGNHCSRLSVGSVRSLVNCLGLLLFKVDLNDWSAVEKPLEVLVAYAIDKRPKVRKCAQVGVEKLFVDFHNSVVIENGSKVVLSMYAKYMLDSNQLKSSVSAQSKSENLDVFHMLNLVTALVPRLSEKIKMEILSSIYKHLGSIFWSSTRHILRLVELLLENLNVEDLILESENIFSTLAMYISVDNNPVDTIVYASVILKNGMIRIHYLQPSIWIKFLPPVFTAIAGYLNSDATTSKHVETILKDLINKFLIQKDLPTRESCDYEDNPEATAIKSICSLFDQIFCASDIYAETLLAVMSTLFLALGESTYFLMNGVLLKLSKKAMELNEELPNTKHLEACVGAAIIAIGPQKVLSLMPLSLSEDKLTCSNTFLLPLLKKYVIGAPLKYFMKHIVPIANSVQKPCKKDKKHAKLKDPNLYHKFWDLLPAFCRYPTDTYKSFEDLSKLFVTNLKGRPSLREVIAKAVQELLNTTTNSFKPDHIVDLPSSFDSNDYDVMAINQILYRSKKSASKNLNFLTNNSMDLFQAFVDIFMDSPPENRCLLKEAIGCLACVLGSKKLNCFFISLLDKDGCGNGKADANQEDDDEGSVVKTCQDEQTKKRRCSILELASAIVKAADEDLVDTIFSFVKSNLLDTDETYHSEAYLTLSKLLEVHCSFSLARIDDLMSIFDSCIPDDSKTMENWFSCYHYLLVHIIKRNNEDFDTKAFLMLNNIIITLKTKKESRRFAYKVLLDISRTLKENQSTEGESELQRLLNMVMGYLSTPNPHMISGAIAALSLLIHNDSGICISVSNLIPAVLALLQSKSVEVIKAALGFIKVLVSSLDTCNLINLLTDIFKAILPWSSVSKHHFRSKVGIIVEILIRKCGSNAVGLLVPEKYKEFFTSIEEGRQHRKHEGLPLSEKAHTSTPSIKFRAAKRRFGEQSDKKLNAPSNGISNGKRTWQEDNTDEKRNNESSKRKFAENSVPFLSRKEMKASKEERKRKRDSSDARPKKSSKVA